MLNDVTLIGQLKDPMVEDTAKTGLPLVRTRITLAEERPDGAVWRTRIPVICFGQQAQTLLTLGRGTWVLLRGKIASNREQGFYVSARSVTYLKVPADVPEMAAGAAGHGDEWSEADA
jgi:hypothetical protein